jgi:hypothetical protein
VPTAGYLAWRFYNRREGAKSLGKTTESAALLVLGGLSAYACCWALYRPDDPTRWDSIRLFLAVLAAVAVAGAALVLLPSPGRRLVISLYVLYHFGGILTAVMSAPPQPWIFQQLWARLYRPYLQFMYLNNAYHFYAPEPGPSCFLWFRVEYQNDAGDTRYSWDEYPKIKDDGTPDYPFSVLYQRRLAMTDHVQHWETSPPPDQVLIPQKEPGQALPAQKKWVMNPIYKWRFVCSPQPLAGTTAEESASAKIKVPFYPTNVIAINQQYKAPTTN